MSRRVLIAVALVLVLLAATAVLSALHSLDAPLKLTAPERFQVAPGASFSRVAMQLAGRGLIAQPKTWILYARVKGLAPAVKAGEYEIQPGTTPRELLTKMVNGQVLLHSFTIVDGWRLQELLEALRRNSEIVSTLPEQMPLSQQGSTIMSKLGSPGIDAEGQFLPETYRFVAGTTDIELLRYAHSALVHELDAAWAERDTELPLHTAYELLIMASIVEKESGLPQELPKIAGLYLHRLAIGMRLQADPTVIYGLGERYDGDIHTVDLRTDGPYNTYTRAGLPPTPIALPGAAVIHATARAEKTDAIYFVASTKGDGSHVFSATLEQHNIAVAAYVAHLRKGRARGAPMSGRGRFITLEGIEGVGKTTQLARLSELLELKKVAHVMSREPGGTPLAESIRQVVLTVGEESLPPTAELLLMFAARAVHLHNHIEPNLRAGRWVICDRFTDATYAYQGGGRGLPIDHIQSLERMVQGSLRPDLTFLLDAPVEHALSRARKRNAGILEDRFELERVHFFERVRNAYRVRAAAEPNRIAVIDATRAVDEVRADIAEELKERSWIS